MRDGRLGDPILPVRSRCQIVKISNALLIRRLHLALPIIPDSEIGTADSTDFTDFEEVVGDDRTNLFAARLEDAANRLPMPPHH